MNPFLNIICIFAEESCLSRCYPAIKKRPEGRSFMRREGFTYPSGACPAENQECSPSL